MLLFSFDVTLHGDIQNDVTTKFEACLKYMEYKKVKNDILKYVIKYFVQSGNVVEMHWHPPA